MRFHMPRIHILIVLFLAILFQGCASSPKVRPTEIPRPPLVMPNPETMGPPEAFGPPLPGPVNNYGPDPVKIKPVILVLGPGLARGFAYVGVLRALKQSKIPVGAIFSTEMGSLIAALYGMSPTLNQFEWGLQKFKESTFIDKGFLAKSNSPSDGDKFETQLKQIFEKKDLSQARIPIKIGVQSQDSGVVMIVDKGPVVPIVRAAIAAPRLFSAGEWAEPNSMNGILKVISAGASRPFLINEAKALGIGPVIVIDVLSDPESAVALDELKAADLVIKPDVAGIDYMDFHKKTDAAFRGKNAILQHIVEIRRLVGLPENNS
jgi:predicted acylesterase/phospholipase RssA